MSPKVSKLGKLQHQCNTKSLQVPIFHLLYTGGTLLVRIKTQGIQMHYHFSQSNTSINYETPSKLTNPDNEMLKRAEKY